MDLRESENKIHISENTLPKTAEHNEFYKESMSVDTVVNESESPTTWEISENVQSLVDAENLLQNGILVETNKGVVCMSLKDVLSANLNLSVEDFKNVATQLLSQEDTVPGSKTNLTKKTIKTKLEEGKEIPLIKPAELKFELPTPIIKSLITPVGGAEIRPSNYVQCIEEFSKETVRDDATLPSNDSNITFTSLTQINKNYSDSCVTSETVDTSEENEVQKTNAVANIPVKRRGGWPKGRKRKPELLNLPPKAPKTSYNIYLNERRKLYKDKLAFHEITRVVGNQWSNLTADEKRPYVERAEEDKKRYREELRVYRQSDAYKLYLARKRKKRAMDNLMSESDMDGTDDIDDEDNDMLYCDTCDQWFYNLHNKREHFLSRQHKILVAGDITRTSDTENRSSVSISTSLDESSMDGTLGEPNCTRLYSRKHDVEPGNVYDNMVQLIDSVTKREKEIAVLDARLKDSVFKHNEYLSKLDFLQEKTNVLQCKLGELKQQELSSTVFDICPGYPSK
ncbi:High mobility group protein 2 [Carabus blaptoides fortunei]